MPCSAVGTMAAAAVLATAVNANAISTSTGGAYSIGMLRTAGMPAADTDDADADCVITRRRVGAVASLWSIGSVSALVLTAPVLGVCVQCGRPGSSRRAAAGDGQAGGQG